MEPIGKGSFENIDHPLSYPANIFVTEMDSSSFHWHYDYELLVLLKGTLHAFCKPEPSLLCAGDLLLFNSRAIHGYKGTGEANLCLFIQFSREPLERVLSKRQSYYFYLNSTQKGFAPKLPYRYFSSLAARICLTSRKNDAGSKLRTHALILSLLADLVEFVQYDIRSRPVAGDYNEEIMDEISRFIDENLQNPHLSQELCTRLGMSEKTLYRFLKNTLGLTLKDLVDSVRSDRSCTLLRETEKPISAISDECGYTNEVTFYRLFKKELGCTPKEYRQGAANRPVDAKIKGYLSFDENEAERLLKELAGL